MVTYPELCLFDKIFSINSCVCQLPSPNFTSLRVKTMAFRGCKAAALFILINVLFFTCVSSHKAVPCPAPPQTKPSPPLVPKKPAKCPKDTLKFGVCGSWLGLVHEAIGTPPSKECCTLISGLADLEAALCLCTAIKASVLGVIKVKIPIAITLLINACGKKVPEGFICA